MFRPKKKVSQVEEYEYIYIFEIKLKKKKKDIYILFKNGDQDKLHGIAQ